MKELLDQLQVIRDELTSVAPGYDGPAGRVFSEIDYMENLINKPKEYAGSCQFHVERTWHHVHKNGARCDCACHTYSGMRSHVS